MYIQARGGLQYLLREKMRILFLLMMIVLNARSANYPMSSRDSSVMHPATVHVCWDRDKAQGYRMREGLFPVYDNPVLSSDRTTSEEASQGMAAYQSGVSRESTKCMQVEDEPHRFSLQRGSRPCVRRILLPEPEVALSIRAFLDEGEFDILHFKKMMKNQHLLSWLLCDSELQREREMCMYPFLTDPARTDKTIFMHDRYSSNIKKVMNRLLGVFCWEDKQSSLSPKDPRVIDGWQEEGRYPKMKKILKFWRTGPFPKSFCGNIMFLVQNKEKLECLGCDMHFLDKCVSHLPASLDLLMPGVLKYCNFYKDVFSHPGIYEQSLKTLLVSIDGASQEQKKYQFFYVQPLSWLNNFQKQMPSKFAANFLFELAKNLMIAEMILGARPELEISIRSIAAYINDRLEYVQFHPGYKGMNTETLNALLTSITRGKSDIRLEEGCVVESGVVYLLDKKEHGSDTCMHPFVLAQGLLAKEYAAGEPPFSQTRAALGVLIKFGLRIEEVKTLQSCMDEAGKIPGYLYHEPLTEFALNEFLKECGKEPIVPLRVLNGMSKTVARIMFDRKDNLKKNAQGNYEFYKDKDADTQAITRDDLVALEGVIMENDADMVFQRAAYARRLQTECSADPLLWAIHVHIGNMMSQMRAERTAIDESRHRLQSLFVERPWVREREAETEDLQRLDKQQACDGEERAKNKLQELRHNIQKALKKKAEHMRKQRLMSEGIDKRCVDLRRRIDILRHFSERLQLDSKSCLTQQPLNMIIMFLRSLGVSTPPLQDSAQGARYAFSAILNPILSQARPDIDFGDLSHCLSELDIQPFSIV